MINKYSVFGFTVKSTLKLPELVFSDNEKIDVNIKFGKVPENLENPIYKGVRFQAKTDTFLLKVDNIGKYLIQNGNEIIIEKAKNVSDDEIRLFLLGSAFGAIIYQRNLLPIHASSIKFKDKCILFCGASGNGKSTTANAFLKKGYELLSDDICVVSLNEKNQPIVYPGYPQLKLWEDIISTNGEDISYYKRIRPKIHKFAIPVKEKFADLPLSIEKIYVLSPNNENKIELNPVLGMKKFNLIKNQSYRFKFVKGLKKEANHFKIAGIIGNKTPINIVKRPTYPFMLDKLIETIEGDFNQQ